MLLLRFVRPKWFRVPETLTKYPQGYQAGAFASGPHNGPSFVFTVIGTRPAQTIQKRVNA